MNEPPATLHSRAHHIEDLLSAANLPPIPPEAALQLARYVSLFVRWNARTNLSAIRDEDGIIRRHILESSALAASLPESVGSLLDYGSGGGLPGIPIALCRPAILVTLAESQNKKVAFLREALRVLSLDATIHAARAEQLTKFYDCVTLRAVDAMQQAVASASALVRPGGILALMTTAQELPALQSAAGPAFYWPAPIPLPASRQALIALGHKQP